jgi:phosphoenolpyruvate carboxylase
MRAPVPAVAAADAADKDRPLREDTRLFGRLLGDVLREQTGVAGFERVRRSRRRCASGARVLGMRWRWASSRGC